jgi:hypothetical protein
MPDYLFSDPAVLAFIAIPVALVVALTWGVVLAWPRSGASAAATARAAGLVLVGSGGWMVLTWAIAASGSFRQWDRTPPPIALLVVTITVLGGRLAFSSLGDRLATHLPLWALVGVQGFRFPLELAMHALADRGIMPEQMSYAGRNFDIVTGITAVVVAYLVATRRAGRVLVLVWNVAGLALLLNVVIVALLSTPIFAVFGPDRLNVFITYPPFVWLPAVMVLAALAGHLVIFRAAGRAARQRDTV